MTAFVVRCSGQGRALDTHGTLLNSHSPCYAEISTEDSAMPNQDLLPSLLFKINENQLPLEATIMELTLWAEKRGATEVGGNIRGALETINRNEEFIKMTLAVMMTPE